ncbi:acyltransferase family protein [Microbacterium sp. zg.Y909]|uniref:acyltransferase family protein n=1 Tax=Microbacterium sp. zg.Y909 TaxID=2969413 RepID=UPI00214C441D|nr:acyltransferase [Microbacterium sp. zg.Y909]MCR2825250.1 acyltransferase [Microbacterium sp. zg.Y909]
MDLTRGTAILLVVLHHSIEIPETLGVGAPRALAAVDAVFAPFRMPLLMFLSGMLLPRSFRRPARDYFVGKARGILWPYLVWSLIVLAIAGELSARILLNVVVYPPTYLWYLWFLFAFYVIAWVLHRFSVPPLGASAVILVASMFLPDDYRLARFAFLMAFFFAGWWWAQAEERLRIGLRTRVAIVAVGLLLAAATAVLSATGTVERYEASFAWGTVGLIAAIALGLPSTATRRWARPLEFVGRNSIVFYVSHYPVILALDSWLLAATDDGSLWISATLTMVAALAVGVVLTVARDRIPVVRWLFEWPMRRAVRTAS